MSTFAWVAPKCRRCGRRGREVVVLVTDDELWFECLFSKPCAAARPKEIE